MTSRNSHALISIVAALLFSLACGGGGNRSQSERRAEATSSSAPTIPEHKPATSDYRKLIVAFGDSLTAGVSGKSYPDDLQDILDANHLPYRVVNEGVSGDTTTDGLARLDNVIPEHPALVLLEFGGNDGLRGIPVSATKKNLQLMIDRLRFERIPVVLLGITLPPNYGPDYVKSFTGMYGELAKKYHLTYMPFLLTDVYQHADMMQPDGIHPNGKGNEVVAQDVFHLIQPILERQQKYRLHLHEAPRR